MLAEFYSWLGEHKEELDHISTILQTKLSDEPEKLIADLEDVEAWNSRAGALLAEANSFLDKLTFHLLPDKEGRTDFERKVVLGATVADIRCQRDKIEALCESIKQRLILGESLMGYFKQFVISGQKNNNLEKLY